MTTFNPIRVAPIGFERAFGFVHRADGCGVGEVELPTYPPSPQGAELRRRRVGADMSLREAAKRAGLAAIQMGDLERGRATIDNWDELLAVLGLDSEQARIAGEVAEAEAAERLAALRAVVRERMAFEDEGEP